MRKEGVSPVSSYRSFVNLTSILSVSVGFTVLVGWLFDIALFKSILPNLVYMRANTALCFILSGLSLFFLQADTQSHSKRLFAQISATIVFLIALGTLIQYVAGLNFGIDELLFRDTTPASILFPGRMAPISAISFVFISVSLFSLDIFPASKVRISEMLSLFVLLLGYISLLGYCFSLQSFFHYRGYDVMALHTAIAFLALAMGVLYSRPNNGMMSVITGRKWGALMWRNLLPAVIILPVVIGAIVESMETYFSFGEEYDSAIMASTLTIIFICIIWYNARSLNESEDKVLYANRLYALLSGINKSIVRGEDIYVFYEHACTIAVEHGHFRMAWIGQKNEQTQSVDVIASAGHTGNYLSSINIDLTDPKRSQGPTGRAICTGLHQFSTDIEFDATMQPWRVEARKSGYKSSAAFPIILKGKVWGSFTVYSEKPHYFNEQEIALLDEVALDIAHAIEVSNNEYERKIAIEELHNSETRFRRLYETTPFAYQSLDAEAKILDVNNAWLEQFGYELGEVIGRPIFEFLVPDQVPILKERIPGFFFTGILHNAEFNFLKKDKSVLTVSVEGRVGYDEQGKFKQTHCVLHNITERKNSELQLKEYTLKLEQAEKYTNLGSWEFNYATGEGWWSKQMFAMFSIEESEKAPDFKTFLNHIHPVDRPIVQTELSLMLEGKEVSGYEFRSNPEDGELRYFVSTVFREKYSVGKPVKYRGTVLDITERKLSEETLRKSEEMYRLLAENATDVIWILDMSDFRFIYVSPSIERLLGFTADEYLKKILPETMAPASMKYLESVIPERISRFYDGEREIFHDELEQYHKLGHTVWTEISAKLAINPKNSRLEASGLTRDITERKKAETVLRESEERFSKIFQSSPIPIALTTIQGNTLIDVNDAWQRMMEYSKEEVVGISTAELNMIVNPDEVTALIQNIQNNQNIKHYKLTLRTKTGRCVDTLFYAETIDLAGHKCILSLAMDISEQKQAEEKHKSLQSQLQQAQKLESLGTLASGIAHDFNNILGIIIGHASLLEHIPVDKDIIQQNMNAINNAAGRGASLVKQLLTFARKTDVLIEPVRINDIVAETSKLLYETFPKTITFTIKLEKPLPYISADTTQIHQVLLNLCVNARDAMPDGGTLSIVTSLVHGESVREKFVNATFREYIELIVADSGSGMDEHTKSRIFEPFFTTKGVGKGTGLGLSLVFGIIEAHNGFIHVDTELGKGTRFSAYFPVPAQFEIEKKNDTISLKDIQGGNETVLIIEDESSLCSLLKTILETKGYNVLTASNGMEGLKQYAQHDEQISLIVSDLGLPKLNGFDVFKQLKTAYPNLKFVIASGYLEPETTSTMLNEGIKAVIHKPYKLEEVLSVVRNTLDND